MENLILKLPKETVTISRQVFISLLDFSPIMELASYQRAITNNEISFEDLKDLAVRSGVPYPLFFAPPHIVNRQISQKNKHLFEKIPTKDEIQVASRGKIQISDIELIIKDLARKQEFLKGRILVDTTPNKFIGCALPKIKNGVSDSSISKYIREYFEFDLQHLRSLSKEKVLAYLCRKIEEKNILVSFSSYNYMPQNISRELGFSGVCIKDKKFPYIFINTRDGDEKPKILESTGRQIFTLLTMVACTALGKFFLNSKAGNTKDNTLKKAFSIAGGILVPPEDLGGRKADTLDELKEVAHFFKVTPSMILLQLQENGLIKKSLANQFRQALLADVKKAEPKQKRQVLPINGYSKYNGERLSREVIKAFRANKVSEVEVKNVLFRQVKMDTQLFNAYNLKFGL
ncbi:MAG: hypothetical protein JNK14_06775 [Chitinophagaceae bacterium]|nr:hypothetical protein [Chitinophagaceae bacterium]